MVRGDADRWGASERGSIGRARRVYDAKVVEGRDGYLFMADDNNEVMAQHSGRLRLGEAELEGWRRVLERRTEMLADRGCAHLVMVAPNNHSVYPEKLPEDVETAAERPVHQLMAHLDRSDSPVKIIYPLDELVAAKADHQVCSRVDSHWTDYGAFLAYMRLMEDARPLVPTRTVDWDDVVVRRRRGRRRPRREARSSALGDAGDRLACETAARAWSTTTVSRAPARSRSPRATSRPPTTCLLLGDSYSYFLAPFMSECWRRLVLAHAPDARSGGRGGRSAGHRRDA